MVPRLLSAFSSLSSTSGRSDLGDDLDSKGSVAELFGDVTNTFETGPSSFRYIPERIRETRFSPSAVTFGLNGQL